MIQNNITLTILTFIVIAFVAPDALAFDCSTRVERKSNSTYCKDFAKGNANKFVSCLEEREKQDCERKERKEQKRLQSIIDKHQGKTSGCFELGKSTESYETCMKSNKWNNLDGDFEMLTKLCYTGADGCDAKKVANKQQIKRDRVLRKKKAKKEVRERNARLAKIEAERKAKKEKIRQQHENQKEVINEAVKKVGYKGVFDKGIALFLYKVKHGENLSDGLNYVFWSDISDRDAKLDAKFTASQMLDDNIIYDLAVYQSKETIEFTIIVPGKANELFLEGQMLRSNCHSFIGTAQYLTVLDVKRTVPIFEEIDKALCEK